MKAYRLVLPTVLVVMTGLDPAIHGSIGLREAMGICNFSSRY